ILARCIDPNCALFLFSFSCFVVITYLHSFPTRRSSDLAAAGSDAGLTFGCSRVRAACPRREQGPPPLPPAGPARRSEKEVPAPASSRARARACAPEILVCRLLLEKKKI